MSMRGLILCFSILAGAFVPPIRTTLTAEPKPDAEWNVSIHCVSDVRDCVLLVFTELGDLTERFPAETHEFVALSNATEDWRGRVMTAAWIGISRAMPAGAGEGVLVPEHMFSAMAMHEPPPKRRFSRHEITAAEAATLAAAVRSMVEECRRAPACAGNAERR